MTGEQIKEARLLSGMTQQELVDAVDIPNFNRTILSFIESGAAEPTKEVSRKCYTLLFAFLPKPDKLPILSKNTQRAKIMAYLEANGKITNREAHDLLFINCPTGRITELRQMGYPIIGTREKGHNYKTYRLGE